MSPDMPDRLNAETVTELRSALAETEENRAAVLRLAEARGDPGLVGLRDATIAAARRALVEPGVGNLIRFWACLDRERRALAAAGEAP